MIRRLGWAAVSGGCLLNAAVLLGLVEMLPSDVRASAGIVLYALRLEHGVPVWFSLFVVGGLAGATIALPFLLWERAKVRRLYRPRVLQWATCGDQWCLLEDVDLSEVNAFGVYIIWCAEKIVRVGIGNVKERLSAHRRDGTIDRHSNPHAPLSVTWATSDDLSWADLEGIGRFLVDQLDPAEGGDIPERMPIPVNFPWA